MNNDKLDALFTGLTGSAEAPDSKTPKTVIVTKGKKPAIGKDRIRQKASEKARQKERFCTIVSSDVMRKIRTIATREGLQIKDVVEAALIKAVNGYERKHGVIEENSKRNAIDLF